MKKQFTLHSLQKRIKAVFVVFVIIFCGLGVRLFFVQVKDGKELQQRATSQWTRDLSLTAKRGSFFDACGDTLAVSYTTYDVYVRAREVKNVEAEAEILSNILGLNAKKVKEKISNKNISEVLLKMQVESDIADQIYKAKLDGVYLTENVGRHYVYGNLLTQLLGFTSIDNVGQSGLEAYLDEYLKGIDGCSYVQSDLQGKEIGGTLRYYVNGISGADVTLTIDSKVQILLENVLQQAYVEQKAKGVTGIVMNAKTSEVLAISSKPSFDLNDVPRDDLGVLFSQSRMNAVTDTYEPGSTFKILTLAAALEEHVVDLDDRFYCPGYRIVDGQKIKCWRTIGHGSQTLTEAFANSCNCCFMDLALRLGKDRFYSYMQKFGLGSKTGITIQGESGGILMKKSQVKNVDLARMGFGHAIAVTPVQLLTAVAGITGGGILKTPTVVEKVVDINGKTLFTPNVTEKRVLSEQTSKTVNQLLQKAENKKADFSFVEGYNVGGKTGTAQKYAENGGIAQGKYISSFIGTYPADNPDYLFMILVDEASAGAYYGSVVAAPYGKIFFANLFSLFNIPKDDPNIVLEEVTMPQITGLSIANAVAELKKIGLEYEIAGDGSFVIKQLPPAGTRLYKGQTVLIIA
ncbi:MAG: PASTA domain-containing protein [Clostridia bacterium]|nr:PASTA domain-containing protein [Clostridia bacterium]